MATKFDLNDDSVVVVVGSGAGGGTVGSQLALKGINTVILEAGGRHEMQDFQNKNGEVLVKFHGLINAQPLALGGGKGLFRIASMDCQSGRWLNSALGRCVIAFSTA